MTVGSANWSLPRGDPKAGQHSGSAPYGLWKNPADIVTEEHWVYDPRKPESKGKVLLGSLYDRYLIGVKDNRHLMTIAGSRAGKGVSTIIPNLIEYPGSILVIDPKGENAQVTANRRGMGSVFRTALHAPCGFR